MKVVLISILFSVISCIYNFDHNKTNDENIETVSQSTDFKSFNLPFPKGTKFEFKDAEMSFSLPQPYVLMGQDVILLDMVVTMVVSSKTDVKAVTNLPLS